MYPSFSNWAKHQAKRKKSWNDNNDADDPASSRNFWTRAKSVIIIPCLPYNTLQNDWQWWHEPDAAAHVFNKLGITESHIIQY